MEYSVTSPSASSLARLQSLNLSLVRDDVDEELQLGVELVLVYEALKPAPV